MWGVKPAAATLAGAKTGLRVSTQSKQDDVGIQTLVGDYQEKGTNHGKKFYQKSQKISGHEDVEVFLYYWDGRDGPEFSGWWFGDQVGGSQVWARCVGAGPQPPKIGWKVPWDCERAEPGALLVEPQTASPAAAGPSVRTAASSPGQLGARVKKATESTQVLGDAVQQVIIQSKTVNQASRTHTIMDIQQSLEIHSKQLIEAQKSLTQDITETRKGGAGATSFVTELSRLSPKLRQLQLALSGEVQRLKLLAGKTPAGSVGILKKSAETEAANKASEERDSKELLSSLPSTKDAVTLAEDSVEAIGLMAAPLVADPPDDDADMLKNAIDEIEQAAGDAQTKITEARSQINAKLQAARKFAPETRKTALQEFSCLQQKLTECQKRLNPYKTFRKEFHALVQARKAIEELTDKLTGVELEIEKSKMMSSAADSGQMAEDEISAAEKVLQPAKATIEGVARQVEQKMRTAEGAMKQELVGAKEKAVGMRKTVDEISLKLKRQRESLTTSDMLKKASDKVDLAETALNECQEAEMPFLKGIEVLPGEESTVAIAACEEAAVKSDTGINQARAFLKTKLAESKRYVKELADKVSEELTAHLKRLEEVSKKLAVFKKETAERKMAAVLAELVDVLATCEKKVEKLTQDAEVLMSENIEAVTTEDIKMAIEKTTTNEKDTSSSLLVVRKIYAAKSREVTGPDAAVSMATFQKKINGLQQAVLKTKKATMEGEKLLKSKALLTEEGEKVKILEVEIEKSEKKVKPGEEMTALGIEGGTATDDEIEAITKLLINGQKTIKISQRALETGLASAPATMKPLLTKLIDRCKVCFSKMKELMDLTKDQRERVMSQSYLKQAKGKVEELDALMEKVNEAELPYLKGIEVLDLTEATTTISNSEAAASAVQSAIAGARTFIASKNLEIKNYGQEVAKSAAEEFGLLTERINSSAAKLGQFKKDTEIRKKNALFQEAGEKVTSLEAAMKNAREVVEPFENQDSEVHNDDVACEKLVATIKETQAILTKTAAFVAGRQKDSMSNPVHKETVKEHQTKVQQVSLELAKFKKVASAHEAKFIAKKALQEVMENVEELESIEKSTAEACAALVDNGGTKFLVDVSMQMLAAALRVHVAEKKIALEDLFKEFTGGANTLAKGVFLSFMAKLPEAIGREELDFTPERREAIFEQVNTSGDGNATLEEFKTNIFKQQYKCIKEITVTDVFEVAKSKTTAKIAAGAILETVTGPQVDESNGMQRIQCSVVGSDVKGFVTMQGNQGTKFVDLVTPLQVFCKTIETETFEAARKGIFKVEATFVAKAKELATAGQSAPVVEARKEIVKMRAKVSQASTNLNKMKAKFAEMKRDFPKKEAAERNAHIEAKKRKEAESILKPAKVQFEALEEAQKAVEEAAQPLKSLTGDDVENCTTPCTFYENSENKMQLVKKAVAETKVVIGHQIELLPKDFRDLKGHLLDAKRELHKLNTKVEVIHKQCVAVMDVLCERCNRIFNKISPEISSIFRDQLQQKGLDIDTLFTQVAGVGEERISDDSFCKYVLSNKAGLEREQIMLVCRHLENGGLRRRRFQGFVQQYFGVVKGIAITDEFEINQAKKIRKIEVDEIIELLGGPRSDEKVGVARIRGRSLVDSVEGWVTLSGNQGTPFLQEVSKPFYICEKEVALDREFKSEGEGGVIRNIKADEIVELIEGPRSHTYAPGLRVKGKSTVDGEIGWFTARDKTGEVFAEADGKYYSCVNSVALTDSMEIKDCKVIRKLTVGELFTIEEGPVEDKDAGICRVKGKSLKDDTVGWITVKGNAGTVYAEKSTKHFCVLQDVSMRKKFPSAFAGEEVRMLKKGEAIQVLEGPKEETYAAEVRLRVKAPDGSVGWVTLGNKNLIKWTPYYKCKVTSAMHESVATQGAALVRDIAAEEVVELLDGPVREGEELRMKGRAEKDGSTGWVTIKNKEGKRLFES